jgi:putative endonuclease
MNQYFVYIMASASQTLYVGVTNDLPRRVFEHKHKLLTGFTAKYNIDRLVYVEQFGDVRLAIAREKQIKGWIRSKKIVLVESVNPGWADLSETLAQADADPSRALRMTNADGVDYADRTVAMSETARRAVEKVKA